MPHYADGMIRCSMCTFKIDEDRFHAIQAHRSHPERATVKIKWQNIRDDKCPMCGDSIRPTLLGHLALLRCVSSDCTFKIREERLNEILADPQHPANTFYNLNKNTNEN